MMKRMLYSTNRTDLWRLHLFWLNLIPKTRYWRLAIGAVSTLIHTTVFRFVKPGIRNQRTYYWYKFHCNFIRIRQSSTTSLAGLGSMSSISKTQYGYFFSFRDVFLLRVFLVKLTGLSEKQFQREHLQCILLHKLHFDVTHSTLLCLQKRSLKLTPLIWKKFYAS